MFGSCAAEDTLLNNLIPTYQEPLKWLYNGSWTMSMIETKKTDRGGRPPKLTNQQILDAAVAIGLPNLTFRGVAKALGVSVPALYHYFKDRDELAEFVANTIIVDYPLPPDGTGDWFQWAYTFAHSQRLMFEKFPGLARVAVQRTIYCAIPRLEQSIRLAQKSGFDEKTAWWATRAVQEFVFSWYHRVEIRDALVARSGENYRDSLRRVVQEFPQGEVPLMRSISERQKESEGERFEFNLRALLAGIAAMRAANPASLPEKTTAAALRSSRGGRASKPNDTAPLPGPGRPRKQPKDLTSCHSDGGIRSRRVNT
jgi:AcrR family transcriptional regulator